MEQLPPKAPTPIAMSSHNNWPSFPFQMMPPPSSSVESEAAAASSWVDDFLDFSATRRNMHRRTVSDPIAFVEEGGHPSSAAGFERLDDEQLRSMFSDEVAAAMGPSTSSNPSTPSEEQNNEQQHVHVRLKNEPGEVDSLCRAASNDCSDTVVDPKRIKRILANRQSAQRSRIRKLQYISELERSVTTLQTEVSALSPRVAFFDHQRLLLNVDNTALKQRIAALAQDKIFKDAHQEALRKEIERLRRVYDQQNIAKMDNDDDNNGDEPPPLPTADERGGTTADDDDQY